MIFGPKITKNLKSSWLARLAVGIIFGTPWGTPWDPLGPLGPGARAPWPREPGPLAQGLGPLGPGARAPWPRGLGPLAQGHMPIGPVFCFGTFKTRFRSR